MTRQARDVRLEEKQPPPASGIYDLLRPGDLLRSGHVQIAKFAATLEIWDGECVAVHLSPFVGGVKFTAPADREQKTYPEFERAAAIAAMPQSSSLKPQASGLPLVRVGQGDFTRDLNEEDLR